MSTCCHQTLVTGVNSCNPRNQPLTWVLFYLPEAHRQVGQQGAGQGHRAHSPGPCRPATLPGEFRGGVSVREVVTHSVMVGSGTKAVGILD